MTTIHQTIEILPDRRLRLDLAMPEDVPAGKAEVTITVLPVEKTMPPETLRSLSGSLANSKAFGRDGVAIQRKMRDEWE